MFQQGTGEFLSLLFKNVEDYKPALGLTVGFSDALLEFFRSLNHTS